MAFLEVDYFGQNDRQVDIIRPVGGSIDFLQFGRRGDGEAEQFSHIEFGFIGHTSRSVLAMALERSIMDSLIQPKEIL